MITESKTRRKQGVAFTMAQARKCLYPYPVYEAHFADNTVARLSFWTTRGKAIDFDGGRRICEIIFGKPAVNGFVEHDDPAEPWYRKQDPEFSGEAIDTAKPRVNGAKLKKAALRIVEQSANGGITPKAVQDLREALNLAA